MFLLNETNFLFSFLHFAMWNGDVMAGALAAIPNSEEEGHTYRGKEVVWVVESLLKS